MGANTMTYKGGNIATFERREGKKNTYDNLEPIDEEELKTVRLKHQSGSGKIKVYDDKKELLFTVDHEHTNIYLSSFTDYNIVMRLYEDHLSIQFYYREKIK